MSIKILSLCMLLAIAGCNQHETSEKKEPISGKQWNPPVAGSIVDKLQERVTEDNLNEKYFRVTVIATDESKAGDFLLRLEYGFNVNETPITLPQWINGIILKPVLKKGSTKYSCQLGFDTGDGQFRELYDIRTEHGNIVLKQTKGYYQTKSQ